MKKHSYSTFQKNTLRVIITLLLFLISSISFGQGNGLYKFKSINGKYGFMDKTGKIKIKAEYLNVGEFSEGLCFVSKKTIKKGYKWIFIDTLGNTVFKIKDKFPETNFSEGFSRISNLKEHWFVNKNGVNEFKKTWRYGHSGFKNGIAYVSDDTSSDFYPINTKGERIGTKTFSRVEIYNLRENNNSKTKGKTKFESDKFVPFQENGRWGYRDSLNNVIIIPKFYKIDKFQNGVCAVKINNSKIEATNDNYFDALIDEHGNVLIELKMHCYLGFQGELIQFYGGPHFGGGVHYLNRKGEKIIPIN